MKHQSSTEQIIYTEPDITGKIRAYPSVTDYYYASARDSEKTINSQHGLSNFSNVVFGDDRISCYRPLSQDLYRIHDDMAKSLEVLSDQKLRLMTKTPAQRKRDYDEARQIVGDRSLDLMEQMMRDKLQQRTKAGPYQLRKTFKYFDRDSSGGIDIAEFSRALELMGFQFNELQTLALFGRYDMSLSGDVDYHDFVDKLMEADFGAIRNSAHGKKLTEAVAHLLGSDEQFNTSQGSNEEDDDNISLDPAEVRQMQEAEVRRIFRMIDRNNNGFISRDEFEILLLALNITLTDNEVSLAISKIDKTSTGAIGFNDFFVWWTESGIS